MRIVVAGVMALAVAACGDKAQDNMAAADAKAANFTPPSVTSRLDYGGAISRRFRTLDRNGDDALTTDELPRANTRLTTLDRNGDGKITQIEYSEGLLARFDAMDLNHDGTVTSEEREAYRGGQRGAPTPVAPGP
ncbi:hypothetical protein KCP91_10720 [Microvirga sp. SRT01]|jgi:hypothetical protein|uniref:EF-hand domain-containing protein n=1 Tax=Sphingomonas longa TaxID=2778730 RepID=A0ABS2D7C9_9SPHN|nr:MULTISPECIES: hypothetical protein [Alphaproteobacteria]MBM6576849.1 hypothetical protein [Sphingomonas sp. BT552]MBR7709893.1 hypothetical protein [Microvirga sp. SRT01]